MKKNLMFYLLLAVPFSVSAQQVLNSAGTTLQNGNISMNISVGEAISTTLKNDTLSFTQGFLQPLVKEVSTALFTSPSLDAHFTVFPNPVSESITVEFTDKFITPNRYDIYANDGRLILSGSPINNALNVSTLAEGVYWVRPIVSEKTYGFKKIIKVK